MESFDITLPSHDLDSEFDVIVYGTRGVPVIAFPTFDFSAGSWENGGMVDAIASLIDDGKVQLFAVDSADAQSWYARNSDLDYRAERQSGYLSFVADELLTYVGKTNGSSAKPILAGCGVGATNAAAVLFRDPSRWGGLLALSGAYDARFYSDGVANDEWLSCSPIDLLETLSDAQIETLKALPIAFVCGQAPDEQGIETQRRLDTLAAERGLEATFEYWGYDVTHSWGWWQQMAEQFLPALLEPAGLARRKYDYVKTRADIAAGHLEDVKAAAEQRLEEEKAAEAHAEQCKADVVAKTEVADKAGALARDAWERRNAVAAQLAALDKQANDLQVAADAAAHALADAQWFAGEAREKLAAAHAARIEAEGRVEEAEGRVEEAQAEADKADEVKKSYESEVEDLEAAAHEKAPAAQKPTARKNVAKRPSRPAAKKPAPTGKKPASKHPAKAPAPKSEQ